MLQDARQWLNSGKIEDMRQARSGATALHVAAAKGYSEVLRCAISMDCSRGRDGADRAVEGGADEGPLQCLSVLSPV